MPFLGREPEKRLFEGVVFGDRLAADPCMMQLLPLSALRVEAQAAGLAAHRFHESGPSGRLGQSRLFLQQSVVLQEIARRTGEVEALARAASAALRARDLARGERRPTADAVLKQAEILALSGALFADAEASRAALERLDEIPAAAPDALAAARSQALRACLGARRALAARTLEDYAAAAADLSSAASVLDAQAREGRADLCEAKELRCELAELLIGSANRSKDRQALDQALDVLRAASLDLDPDYRPLTWSRLQTLRGQALALLGDFGGEPALIVEGSSTLARVVEEIDQESSPLDAARAAHALGLVLQTLGEACDEDASFQRALAAFEPALEVLEQAPHLPFRSVVAHDAAACLARRAERRGDLEALKEAETRFRRALLVKTADSDPLGWAVTQVALARIYEAVAEIRGDTGERADAAFALASALDVFAEHGLRSLTEAALTALARVKPMAEDPG